jgi:hypothetical protein
MTGPGDMQRVNPLRCGTCVPQLQVTRLVWGTWANPERLSSHSVPVTEEAVAIKLRRSNLPTRYISLRSEGVTRNEILAPRNPILIPSWRLSCRTEVGLRFCKIR